MDAALPTRRVVRLHGQRGVGSLNSRHEHVCWQGNASHQTKRSMETVPEPPHARSHTKRAANRWRRVGWRRRWQTRFVFASDARAVTSRSARFSRRTARERVSSRFR